MPDIGFAVGNGTSRAGFDLTRLDGHGVTVGCNYQFRDWPTAQYIVTLDKAIGEEVRAADADDRAWRSWQWLTREYPHLPDDKRPWLVCDHAAITPLIEINEGFNNNSGVMAAAFLAEIARVRTLYLVGIDFFLEVPSGQNDIYGYNTRQSQSLCHVWNKLVASNPQTRFVRVGEIADRDRDYFDNQLEGFEYLSSLEAMPIRER